MSEGRSERSVDDEERAIDDEERAIDKLVSVGLWAAGLSWLVPMMGSMMAAQTVLRSDQIEWLNRLYCKGQLALTGNKWRAVVDPSIDPNRQYMFCQNHTNNLDHVAMYNATPHFKQGIELEKHFKIPVYGWYMRQRGTIPVKPNGPGSREALREGIRQEIERGHSLLVFPEGTRTRTGRVAPFRTGVIRIARDLGLPIVPVAVTGMFEVLRPKSLMLRAGNEITVYCEAPIETKDTPDERLEALAEDVRQVIAARVDAYYDARARP